MVWDGFTLMAGSWGWLFARPPVSSRLTWVAPLLCSKESKSQEVRQCYFCLLVVKASHRSVRK